MVLTIPAAPRRLRPRLVASLLAAAFGAGAAQAQIIDQSTIVIPQRPQGPSEPVSALRRDRDVPVLERALPAFAAQGVKIGSFDFFPGLMVAPEFISNVYANNANRHADAALVLRPEFTLRNTGGLIDLDLFGRGAITRLAKFTSENTEEVIGGARLEAPVGPLATLSAGASYGNRIVQRYSSDSPVDAAKPLEYRDLEGNVAGQLESGRIRVSARADLSRLRFSDVDRVGGGTIYVGDRDRTVVTGLGRIDYVVKPDTTFYVAASINRFNYKRPLQGSGLDRDSRGWGLFVGTTLDVTKVIRADFRAGYIRQNFDAKGVRAISGLGLLGSLIYFPTRLATVTLRGERAVRDTGVPGTLGYIHTGGELQADQELRRYLILSLITGISTDDFRGLTRRDHNAYAALSATYLSRNHWNAKLGYQYNRRHCQCGSTGAQFDDHRLLAGLTFQY